MSTLTIRYSSALELGLKEFRSEIRQAVITATAQALQVDPKGVIVDFQPWSDPFPVEAPEVLFRAETSIKRRELLKPWAEALIQTWKNLAEMYPNLFSPEMRVAVKPYVIDSEWLEETL